MYLNTLTVPANTRKKRRRCGRGIGSGLGKTSGRGHKGQKSRSGGYHKVGFEGGQMPLQRRLPKFGFSSRIGRVTAELRVDQLDKLDADVVDINTLKEAGLLNKHIRRVKIIASGELTKAVTLSGIKTTRRAYEMIIKLGGQVEE